MDDKDSCIGGTHKSQVVSSLLERHEERAAEMAPTLPLENGDGTTQPSVASPAREPPQISSISTPSTGGVLKTDRNAIALCNKTRHANSAFQYAIHSYDQDRLDDILNSSVSHLIDVNMVLFENTAILNLASSTSNKYWERALQMAEELLQHPRVNVNFQQPKTLFTALHMATLLNNAKMCRLLLQHGADPDMKDATGRIALDVARSHNCDDVIVAITEHQNRRDAAAVLCNRTS